MDFTSPEALPAEPVDLEGLRQTERLLRDRLRLNPVDNGARIRLAWCLFAQTSLLLGPSRHVACSVTEPGTASDRMAEALRHANVALHLSNDHHERQEVAMLRSLAELAGGSALIRAADLDAARRVTSLSRELRRTRRLPSERARGPQRRRSLTRIARTER